MLFTRCPDCDTTFRVTDDALRKANGQVRCGRCASVFNAYAERRDGPGETAGDAPAEQPASERAPAAPEPLQAAEPSAEKSAHSEAPAAAVSAPQATSEPSAPEAETRAPNPPIRLVAPGPRDAALEPSADPLGALSVADVVAQLDQGAVDEDADTGELRALDVERDDAIPPAQVAAVLETEPIGDWRHVPLEPPRRSGWWGAGVAAAVAALALQAMNHYRAELVKQPSVGSIVQSAYAALGITVLPRWDVRQYEILDWVATAEPSTSGIGSLRITARIKNLGPQYQPYPDVNLRLKDRWEAAVGGRVFAPAEYLAAAPRKLMAPGETARAQLELVDPGPDAYGFDLDVCVEIETHVLSCRNDKVFL
jgi:predicted Zn finger-like uncharacterized protein